MPEFRGGPFNLLLDSEITFKEVMKCIAQSKKGKAPGVDGIGNEFYKSLPQNWILYIFHLFNSVLVNETIPKKLGGNVCCNVI